MRRALIAAGVATVLAATGVGVVRAATTVTAHASCTASPVVSDGASAQTITVKCSVPKPPTVTVTATVPGPTVTVTASPAAPSSSAPVSSAPSSSAPSSTPAAPTSSAPASDGALSLPRIPWEGGAAYYERFATATAGGWADPAHFPVGVFFGKPEHAAQLKALGINFYMGAEHDGATLKSITDQGVDVLAQQDEWSKADAGSNVHVPGWFISDECDMGLGNCDPANENTQLASQKSFVTKVQAYGDGRFDEANFGNGILRTWWSPNTMTGHVALVDAVSADKYSYTSPPVDDLLKASPDWPKGANPATSASYGWQVDQMRSFMTAGQLKPAWVFVETKRPYLTESNARTITPDQVEGAVWSGLIHEARGVTFFQHNNDGTCGNYSLIQCGTAIKDKVARITADLRSLASVLNSQSYKWSFGAAGIDSMLKTYQGSAYVFADVGLSGTAGTKTLTLPAGVSGSSVTVVGENRTIPVVNGAFTDTFAAEYTHHVYKIGL